MEELDKKWILLNNTNCDTTDSPSTLGLVVRIPNKDLFLCIFKIHFYKV